MIADVAVLVAAIAFAVLVAYLAPLLIQWRRTAAEAEQLVTTLNSELPTLINELRATSRSVNDVVHQARDGVEHAAVLLHAIGEVGDSVNQVHDLVRGSGSSLLANAVSIFTGFKAAKQVVTERLKEGGHYHGGT
jgi:uncharacterized protein YoxC